MFVSFLHTVYDEFNSIIININIIIVIIIIIIITSTNIIIIIMIIIIAIIFLKLLLLLLLLLLPHEIFIRWVHYWDVWCLFSYWRMMLILWFECVHMLINSWINYADCN